MSDAYLVRRGGSGGLSANAAVLHVTATAGSTVSLAKGAVVTKVLGPGMAHVRSSDSTLADWYYAVSPANYGSWTVTATLGTDTQSVTVAISDNKQYDIDLYTFYVYNQGNTYDCRTGGYTQSHGSGSIATFETGYISIHQTATSGRGLLLTTNNTFDMSRFKTLFVEYTHAGELLSIAKFGVRLSQDYTDNSFTASAGFTTQSNKTVGSVDLSSVNSSLRVGFYDGVGDCKIYRAWLERA